MTYVSRDIIILLLKTNINTVNSHYQIIKKIWVLFLLHFSNSIVTQIFISVIGGWKYRVNLGEDAGTNGWEHDFVGYVYPMSEEDGGTVPICVGYESDHWSNLVKQGECLEVRTFLLLLLLLLFCFVFCRSILDSKPSFVCVKNKLHFDFLLSFIVCTHSYAFQM